MTGFARSAGNLNGLAWAWEARSVNGKSLDVRLRLPPTYERLEQAVRVQVGGKFKRGNFQINLEVREQRGNSSAVVNEGLLEQLLVIAERQRRKTGGPPVDVAALLNIKGVVEAVDVQPADDTLAARDGALLAGLESALAELAVARRNEGERLSAVLAEQLGRINELVRSARDNPARAPEAVRQRLSEQVQRLLDASKGAFDTARLHQEATLLATKADIQEEIDRLLSHIVAARKLLKTPDAVGRKLEFLMQELNREANTLCSKSSDISLTETGLELKLVIDQLREQALNIE
jgi:uncharacterized protein (TIGR00255 family)